MTWCRDCPESCGSSSGSSSTYVQQQQQRGSGGGSSISSSVATDSVCAMSGKRCLHVELWTPALLALRVGSCLSLWTRWGKGPQYNVVFRRLAERTFGTRFPIRRIKYYKRPNGEKTGNGVFRVALLEETGSDQNRRILFETGKRVFRATLLSF